jgi:pSer/pThr/pTyr-binding forkhead associated (FHA) protein
LPGQEVITVGRQKRRTGDPSDQGNDVVLRVPGNDPLSTRISRRHFELHRQGGRWFITDRSKAGTLRNAQPIPRDVLTPLEAGDRLLVAGLITLELSLEVASTLRAVAAPIELPPTPGRAAAVVLEATLGDMVTCE